MFSFFRSKYKYKNYVVYGLGKMTVGKRKFWF